MMAALEDRPAMDIYQALWVVRLLEVTMVKLEALSGMHAARRVLDWAREEVKRPGGLTVSKLAVRCGVSRPYLSMYLRGKSPTAGQRWPEETEKRILSGLMKVYLERGEDERPG